MASLTSSYDNPKNIHYSAQKAEELIKLAEAIKFSQVCNSNKTTTSSGSGEKKEGDIQLADINI